MIRLSLGLLALALSVSSASAGISDLFTEKSKDFGAVTRGPKLVHYYKFNNTTGKDLIISEVRVSCGACTVAWAPVATVKAGENSYIGVQMDTLKFDGFKQVTIFVKFTSPVFEEVQLTVAANARNDIQLSAEGLAFGSIRKGGETTAETSISLTGFTYAVTGVSCDSSFIKAKVDAGKRGLNETTYKITATSSPELPVGKWYTDVWATTNNPGAPKIRIPVTIEVTAPFTATPATLQAGEVVVGSEFTKNVTIRGDKSFKIKEIKAGEGVTVKGGDGEGTSHVLKVTIKPGKLGEFKQMLEIIPDVGDPVKVPISGEAVKE